MAVAFDAVGPSSAGAGNLTSASLSWSHTCGAAATVLLVGVAVGQNTANDNTYTTAVTYNGVAMASAGGPQSSGATGFTGGNGYVQVFRLISPPTGSALTVQVTVTGGTPKSLAGGSISFSGAGSTGPAVVGFGSASPATVTVASNTSGNLIAAFTGTGSGGETSTAPATSRFIIDEASTSGCGNCAGETTPSTGSSLSVGWTTSADIWALVAVEVRALVPAPPPPPAPSPQLPPGWFPGADQATAQPGGVPFWAQPAPADATPAVIFLPTPEAAPARPVPPGWFPGADAVISVPDGIPFTPAPPPLNPAPAVVFPVPEVAGEVQWLPWPPNYFPGSQAVSVDPGGIPFYPEPQPLTAPPAPPPPLYIAQIVGSGTSAYFADQYGQPRFMLHEQAWALPWNAGNHNGGLWQSDMDTYFATRASQGYTAWFGVPWMDFAVNSGGLSGGRSWDGIYPLLINGTPGAIVTGSETITLNNAYWTRLDYMFRAAARNGITCFVNLGMSYDFNDAGGIFQNLSTTQATALGAALATRYPQGSYPNVFFFWGDDSDGTQDTFFTAMLSGLRSAGDNRSLISIEYFQEANCHIEYDTGAIYVPGGFGVTNATYNFSYTYDPTYLGIEKGYTETGTTLLPVVYGDGIWYGDSQSGAVDYTIRRVTWWALASGVRGMNNTCGPSIGGPVWQWTAGAVANLTNDANGPWITGHVGNVVSYFTSLTGWHQLIPDTGNRLITAGRGTKSTNGPPAFNSPVYGDTDNYVAGSRTPDGSLAVIYCGQFFSITINQALLGPGYTATWVDPWNLATQTATPGSTFNSTPLGNNSAGNPDWALVLQGPPALTQAPTPLTMLPPGWFPGADQVITQPGGIPFYAEPQPADQVAAPPPGISVATAALAGAGAVSAVVTQDAGTSTTLAGAGAVSAVATVIPATATLAGAGTVTALVTQACTAALAGAGAVTDVVTQAVTASPAGAGTVTDVVTEAVTATAAGAGAVNGLVTQPGGGTITGSGAVGTAVTQGVIASLAGAGSVTDVVTLICIAAIAGAGSVNANVAGGGSTANLAGAGAVSALATQAVTAAAPGTGQVTALVTQIAPAALAGAGSVNASGAITGTASLAGAGHVTAAAAQAATGTAAAAGTLSALAAQQATAALTAAGAVSATGTGRQAITAAQSTATITQAATGTATVTDPRDGTDTVS